MAETTKEGTTSNILRYPKDLGQGSGKTYIRFTIVDRKDIKLILDAIIDEDTTRCCQAERLYLTQMEGDCATPIGCWARSDKNTFFITGYSADMDGTQYIKKTVQGDILDANKLAVKLAQTMIQDEGREFVSI